MGRSLPPHRIGTGCAVLLAVAFTGVQLTAVTGRDSPDSRNYISHALSLSGESRARATARTIDYVCADPGGGRLTWIPWTADTSAAETADECGKRLTASAAYWLEHGNTSGMTGPFLNHRYMAIFEARPGYPLLLVPFVSVFGLAWGIWLAGLAVTLAGSLLVLAALRVAGAPWPAALCGQALYLALPTGTTAMRPMSDGLAMAGAATVVLGATLALNGRRRAGPLVVTGGAVLVFVTRYSQALLLTAALTVALAALVGHRRLRRRPLRPAADLLVLCALLTAAMYAAALLLGWPGGEESVQDLLTDHYRIPDVADPWRRFLEQELGFWPAWFRLQLADPVLLLALGLSAWALVRRPSSFGLVAAATAAAGVLNQAGHPNPAMATGPRLIVLVWFLPVLVLPTLGRRRTGAPPTRRLPGRPGPPAGGRSESPAQHP
ncbi:hypothetical protein [Kitasatospora sp. NPDC051914]|uniref:hypothetical protein n=1 Tax=Kitasatospora sp. NPDC051914 TaxID=3154945 RepID=UPI0034157282